MLEKEEIVTKYKVLGQEITRKQAIELLRDLVKEFNIFREPSDFDKKASKVSWLIPSTTVEAENFAIRTCEYGGEIMLELLKKQLAELR